MLIILAFCFIKTMIIRVQEAKEECLAWFLYQCLSYLLLLWCEGLCDLTLEKGERQRFWDSCMFYEFSRVAMDHIFMPDREARIKHRMYHKLTYYQQQFEAPGCVGCGRCVTTCIKRIDPVDIVARIQADPNPDKEVKLYTPPEKKVKPELNPWEPQKAVIKSIKEQTPDVRTYTISFVDPEVQEDILMIQVFST